MSQFAQKGFSNTVILVVVAIVVVIAGWWLVNQSSAPTVSPVSTSTVTVSKFPTKSTTPSSTVTLQSYNGTGFNIKYPITWKIQGEGCSDLGGINCAIFAPFEAISAFQKKYGTNGLAISGFSSHKTAQTPEEWFKSILEPGPFAEEQTLSISGYSGLFIKKMEQNSYTDYIYVISNGNMLVYFYFRSYEESHPYGGTIRIDDYSKYLPEFKSIVNSISFK